MTKQEIAERYCLDDNTIFIEPEDEFNGGIIGVSEDRQHVIYDYDKTVESIAAAYARKNGGEPEDYYDDAREWFEYNTLRSLPYQDQSFVPIISVAVEE